MYNKLLRIKLNNIESIVLLFFICTNAIARRYDEYLHLHKNRHI